MVKVLVFILFSVNLFSAISQKFSDEQMVCIRLFHNMIKKSVSFMEESTYNELVHTKSTLKGQTALYEKARRLLGRKGINYKIFDQHFDLSAEDTEIMIGLNMMKKFDHLELPEFKEDITLYTAKILLLKSRDTVTFANGKTFKLGEFLGRGDSTHIFALADNPDIAIRIPYIASGTTSYKMASKYMKQYVQTAPNFSGGFIKIQILETALHENLYLYLLVDRVHGSKIGRYYLKQKDLPFERYQNIGLSDIEATDLDELTKDLLRNSYYLAKHDEWFMHKENIPYDEIYHVSRQFLLDDHSNRWILVDWE